jgi:flagellar secretion chaperone FliS
MSDKRTNVREQYLEQMVESASPEGLLLMLVDGAANFIRRAEIELEKERLDEVHNCLVKAQNIYMELVISLDMDAGEFAENMALVYQFLYNLLIEANIAKSKDKIESALKLAEQVRDIWREAAEKSRAENAGATAVDAPVEELPIFKVHHAGVYEPGAAATIVKSKPELPETPVRLNITG